MLRSLYSFFLIIFYVPYLIIIVLRIFIKKEHKYKFKEKIFLKKIKRPNGFLFWFHAASIGEFNSILPILNYYSNDKKNNFLITTVTLTSYYEFEKKFGKHPNFFHQFLPYDLNIFTKYFLNSWKPDIVSFVDSEIWPNFIFSIKNQNIPLILLNARITKKTLKRWLFFKKFSKLLFGFFDMSIASSKETEKNLMSLNVKNIKYFGNLKFCSLKKNSQNLYNHQFSKLNGKKLWCAVSTHKGEEIFCAKVHKIVKQRKKESLCVIIPRHVNRNQKIFLELKKLSLKIQIKNEEDIIDETCDIVLVNYYGSVDKFLSKIQNVFIGKSLIKKLIKVGGQNPIEAAKKGCNIFHGPYVYNFEEIYDYLGMRKFSKTINNPNELANGLLENFNNNKERMNKEKVKELEIFSNSIFEKIINEYNILINDDFKA